MAKALAAAIQGIDYQSRWFWLKACDLLEPNTKVQKVVYEDNNVKSLDDVVVHYQNHPQGQIADYYQVKFHVSQAGALTAEALTQPEFINAESVSLLQRMHNAHCAIGRAKGYRFFLYTPWTIHPDDDLKLVHSNHDGEILWAKLSLSGPRSKVGRIREMWKSHLNIQEGELAALVSCIRLHAGPAIEELGRNLNYRLRSVGLKPVDEHLLVNPYDDLIRKLLVSGRHELTAQSLQDVCLAEGLWDGGPRSDKSRVSVGIRSFTRYAEDLHNQTSQLACVANRFDGRAIKAPELWNSEIFPEITKFVDLAVRPGGRYLLHLDTHSSIAFAAGFLLPSKANVDVAVFQKSLSGGGQVWDCALGTSELERGEWEFADEIINANGTDTILGVSLARDVRDDVRAYVRNQIPNAAGIVNACLAQGPGNIGIVSGPHAYRLAEALIQKVCKVLKDRGKDGRLHVFAAAPNGFMFFIGRLAQSIQKWSIYEYAFESNVMGAYSLGIEHPIAPPSREQLARGIIKEGV